MSTSTQSYVSLANKYRPQTFEDMVGQESISKTLQNALKLGRIGHAYLFYGPRGCGKTTTARILAKALNCTGNGATGPTAQPCGKCPQCLEIAKNEDMDVQELDAASNTQVEKVRETIIDTVALAASRDRFKVFILDEVHMLSASSFNALLKTIEEPPAHVVFILATTEKHKVPATIVSRCQTFRFRPLTVEEISSHLVELAEAEGIDLSAAAAKIIAKNAGGAMRDGLTLLDRAIAYAGDHIDEKTVSDMLGLTSAELLQDAVRALCNKDNAQMHQVFQTLQNEGFDANTFLKDLKNTLSDLFYFSLGQGSEPFAAAQDLLASVSTGFLARLTRKLSKLIDEVKFSDNALVSAEVGLFTVMDSVLDIDGFIRRLEALEGGQVLPPSTPSVPHTPAPRTTKAPKPQPKKAAATAQEPAPKITPAAAAEPGEPVPALDQAISNRQVWDKMLAKFGKGDSPFIYDVMISAQVKFVSDQQWQLCFEKGKEFYQITAQRKLAELSAAATELAGRPVNITLEQTQAAAAAAVPQKVNPKPQPTAAISDEEPFALGPFEQDTAAQSADAPEEVRDILEMFPGELIA